MLNMKKIKLQQNKIWIPVWTKGEKQLLTFSAEGTKIAEFMIPYKENSPISYYAPLLLDAYIGKEIYISGEFSEIFWDSIQEEEPVSFNKKLEEEPRPLVHFAAQAGWINDPNGLIYVNGIYHLYFQYNPFDTEWENMSWGHASSTDLLHWNQENTVMYPDEFGMMFSGCGLVNERKLLGLPSSALLFFYSAAGSSNAWSNGKEFTQRIAYSLDGGASLVKSNRGYLPTIRKENRDPKIFWHEETMAYIMVLWLEGNSFAILRTTDLEHWSQSQILELPGAWECPDLFSLKVEGEDHKWVFWSADGFYYVGDFDGYCFTQESQRREAYLNKMPYAAQTYWGTLDRTLTVPWLRTENVNRCYRGLMGVPRELSLVKEKTDGTDTYVLKQSLTREWEEQKTLVLQCKEENQVRFEFLEAGAFEIQTAAKTCSRICWKLVGNELVYEAKTGFLSCGEVTIRLPENMTHFTFILDESIVEVTNGNSTLFATIELKEKKEHTIELQGEDLDEIFIYKVS